MNLLLDTHVWVWAVEEPGRLGPKARRLLENAANSRSVCAVSALEIARLIWSGDLVLRIPLAQWVRESLTDLRADSIAVTQEIAFEAYRLPEPFHRDPADRQIVACARLNRLTLVTADDRILAWSHVATADARK